jgi:uncharacterized integral membrane protein
MNIKVILVMIIAGLAVLFIIQNVSAVTVGIFFWKISLSLALLIFFVLTIGFAMGWFLHSFLSYQKVKKEVSEIQRDLGTGKKK